MIKTASRLALEILDKVAKEDEPSHHILKGWIGSRRHSTNTTRRKNELLRKLVKQMGYNPKKFQYGTEIGSSGPFYRPSEHGLHVDPGRNPIVYAHEAMHASPETGFEKVLGSARLHSNIPMAPVLAMGSLLMYKHPRLRTGLAGTSLGIGALQAASTIGEEMRATYKGRRVLEEMGIEVPEKEFKRARNIGLLAYGPQQAIFNIGVPAGVLALSRMR